MDRYRPPHVPGSGVQNPARFGIVIALGAAIAFALPWRFVL
jgi:hypothetical protein